jgi:hypothetical protein
VQALVLSDEWSPTLEYYTGYQAQEISDLAVNMLK